MNSPNPLYLRDEELDHGLELLYFADRQLDADVVALRLEGAMDEIDHQALFLIERHPGITLADLCAALERKQADPVAAYQAACRDRADRTGIVRAGST